VGATSRCAHTGSGELCTWSVAMAYDCTCTFWRLPLAASPSLNVGSQLMVEPTSFTSSSMRPVSARLQWTPFCRTVDDGVCYSAGLSLVCLCAAQMMHLHSDTGWPSLAHACTRPIAKPSLTAVAGECREGEQSMEGQVCLVGTAHRPVHRQEGAARAAVQEHEVLVASRVHPLRAQQPANGAPVKAPAGAPQRAGELLSIWF
jgi:hypothetical protein